ncbi:MAG TPA: alkanesulfonate monooxygenase, partial [Acidovorax sp.]|nr:alkanesulfonate monooxygenase [Acidovorax sp.]
VFPLLPLPLRNRLVSGNPLFGNPLGPFGETVANDFVPRASQS